MRGGFGWVQMQTHGHFQLRQRHDRFINKRTRMISEASAQGRMRLGTLAYLFETKEERGTGLFG